MAGERWAQAQQALIGVAEQAARYDETGVDVYFVNSKRVGKELKASFFQAPRYLANECRLRVMLRTSLLDYSPEARHRECMCHIGPAR